MSMTERSRRQRAPTALGFAALLLMWSAAATPTAQDLGQRLRDWAAAGEIESIRTLLAGEDPIAVDSPDAVGWTALLYAADAGHNDVVGLLLDAGASPQSQNLAQETALHLAGATGLVGRRTAPSGSRGRLRGPRRGGPHPRSSWRLTVATPR